MLRKRREPLELNAEIEATTAKINYLREAEFNLYSSDKIDFVPLPMPVIGAEAAEATADTSAAIELDERLQHSLHLQDRISLGPAVRPKTGVQVQFPLFDSALDRDRHHSRSTFHPRPTSDVSQPQRTPPHGFPSATPQSQSSSAQATQYPVPQRQNPSVPMSSSQESHISKMLENQSELTRMLMKQQLLSTLPQGNIPIFDGHVLEYRSFIHSFENMIDNSRDRLQFLIQYTRGQAQRLVKSCEYMTPYRGYQKAKKLLKNNFGNEYKISCAYLEKALSWPQMKSEDSKVLQDYAMFLRSCCNTMEDLEYMDELNTVSSMRSIALKLPYKLREKWRNKPYELQEQHNRRVRILDLVTFIERQARIAADPVFGYLQDQTVRGKIKSPVKLQALNSSGSSYVTNVALSPKETKPERPCPFCSSNHTLNLCKDFAKKAHRDTLSFLKTKGICFGCLSIGGHISKDCKNRLTCNICKKAHPSALHIEPKDHMNKDSTVSEPKGPSGVIGGASAELCGHIGAGDQESVLPIVPVRVKAAKGSHVHQVYALLDPGSSATFCSEELMSQLGLKGKRTHILLRTLNQEMPVPAYVVSGLEVSALDSDNFLPLPDTFTQKEMPVTTSSIPEQTDLTHWAYLSQVTIPTINSKVELLIGTNAPNFIRALGGNQQSQRGSRCC